MKLNDADVKDYQHNGYLVVERLCSDEEVGQLRLRTEEIAAGRIAYPEADIELEPDAQTRNLLTARKINRCVENDTVFLAHSKNPQILDVVEQLIGPDIKLYGSQCFMKPPGGVEKPYHQDSAYFSIEPMELVTCWTALDDVTIDNGCMWVVAGSHREGLLDHSEPWFVGGRQDMQVPDSMIDQERKRPIVMPAGSCSFHHSLLLHRSTANNTDSWRRGFAVHYMSARCRWTHPTQPQPDYLSLRGNEYADCV